MLDKCKLTFKKLSSLLYTPSIEVQSKSKKSNVSDSGKKNKEKSLWTKADIGLIMLTGKKMYLF